MSVSSNLAHPSFASRALLSVLLVGSAAGLGATAASAAAAVHTPQSIECSKEADAKGLHGKEREKFRSECKRNAKTSQATPAPKTAPAKAGY